MRCKTKRWLEARKTTRGRGAFSCIRGILFCTPSAYRRQRESERARCSGAATVCFATVVRRRDNITAARSITCRFSRVRRRGTRMLTSSAREFDSLISRLLRRKERIFKAHRFSRFSLTHAFWWSGGHFGTHKSFAVRCKFIRPVLLLGASALCTAFQCSIIQDEAITAQTRFHDSNMVGTAIF